MTAIEQLFGTNTTAPQTRKTDQLGQEDFLKLLVAQMKNQDPSNPVENGEFLGQIAQFSMVSGIDELGTSFDGIASSLFATQAMQASQLVGKDVLVESDTATLAGGGSVSGVIGLSDPARNVTLRVHDITGSLVRSVSLGNMGAGSNKFSWNGLDQSGNAAPAGDYIVLAEGLVNGNLQGLPLQIFSKVESISVDRGNTSVSVSLAGNKTAGISQIREFK